MFLFQIMNSDCRKYIQSHLKVKMEREPGITPVEMKDWLLGRDQTFDLSQVNPKTLYKFVERNMPKFKEYGTLERRAGSGRSNKISGRLVTKIKRLSLNKNRRGARKVAAIWWGFLIELLWMPRWSKSGDLTIGEAMKSSIVTTIK